MSSQFIILNRGDAEGIAAVEAHLVEARVKFAEWQQSWEQQLQGAQAALDEVRARLAGWGRARILRFPGVPTN